MGLGLLAASGAVGFSKQNWVVDEGATLAQTRLRNGAAAMAVPAGVLAANAPDVDAVTMFVSRDLSLGFRRGWTHGVLAMAVLPLVLTVPARARPGGGAVGAGRRHGRGHCCRLTSARVLGHPLLDWLNTYGVRFLMPFDGTWPAGRGRDGGHGLVIGCGRFADTPLGTALA